MTEIRNTNASSATSNRPNTAPLPPATPPPAAASTAASARSLAAPADSGAVSGATILEAHAGPRGANALPALPTPPAGFENFSNFAPSANATGRVNAGANNGVAPDGSATGAAAFAVPTNREQYQALLQRLQGTDPQKLSREEAGAIAKLGSVADPALKAAVADLGARLLATSGGLSAQAIAANPSLGKLVAPLAKSGTPEQKAQIQALATQWTDVRLGQALQGREGEDGLKAGVDAFKASLRQLATDTGLGEVLGQAARSSMERSQEKMVAIADIGKSWLERQWDGVVSDFQGLVDVSTDIGSGLLDLGGDVIERGFDLGAMAIEGNTAIMAAGLDLVGADSAAQTVSGVGQAVGGAVRRAGESVDNAIDTVAAVADGAIDGTVRGGALGAAEAVADQVLGPERTEFAGQIGGLTGIVANRLAPNQSVFVRGEVSGEIAVGAFVGAKLGSGAIMGRDSSGNITLTVEMSGGVEAGVKAKVGGSVGTSLASVGAEANASASVFAGGKAKVTMKFDPNKPEDVARLRGIIEGAGPDSAGLPGNPLSGLVIRASAVADALEHNWASTEVAVDEGAKTGASATASLATLTAKANVGVEGVLGASMKLDAAGNTTTTFVARASAKAGVSLSAGGNLGIDASGSADAVMSLSVKRNAQGEIIGLSGGRDFRLQGTVGPSGAVRESFDLAKGENGISKASGTGAANTTRVTTVERELNAAGLAEAQRRLTAGQDLQTVFGELSGTPGMYTETRTTSTTDSVSLGLGVSFFVGVGGEAKFNMSAGRITTVSERDEVSSLHQDLATDSPVLGGSMPDTPSAPGTPHH